ncbi:hypothetical protein PR003_g7601 [Phytophthora rubi]|uniref:Uncharacterized protein n=1 Tax=Phytophthora rubi TaxID=129364 RepID=A0A6A4FDJ1_9STRA|nr:hypothetical protein PR003_g7601 [Phytophthora rubi]
MATDAVWTTDTALGDEREHGEWRLGECGAPGCRSAQHDPSKWPFEVTTGVRTEPSTRLDAPTGPAWTSSSPVTEGGVVQCARTHYSILVQVGSIPTWDTRFVHDA